VVGLPDGARAGHARRQSERWAKTKIDSFILAALKANGLKPSAESDPRTLKAVDQRVSIHDIHATMLHQLGLHQLGLHQLGLHQLGLDHEKLTYRYAGRAFRLTDVYTNVVRDVTADGLPL
jgi:hypothetical protein